MRLGDYRMLQGVMHHASRHGSAPGLQVLIGILSVLAAGAGAQDVEPLIQPQGLAHAGILPLRALDPSLDGTGLKVAVIARSRTYDSAGNPENDYRPLVDHPCLAGVEVSLFDHAYTPAGISPHATAVCSILFGRDAGARDPVLGAFAYEGAVPAAGAQVYEFNYFMETQVFPLLDTGLVPPEVAEADVISLSCGHDKETWWTRGLETLVDRTGIPVVASIGNGRDADHPLLYPGAAANLIGVGVMDSVRSDDPLVAASHFGLAYPEHSSCGPALDGRCKPDLVAPGNCLVADAGTPGGYRLPGNWSSYATPVVTGIVAQLAQKARQDETLAAAVSAEAGGRVLKAILLNSATKLPHWHKGRLTRDDDQTVPLDYAQGAGAANALAAYRQLTAGQQAPGAVRSRGWDLNHLEAGRNVAHAYRFTVPDPEQTQLTCTVVWNRRYPEALDLERVDCADLRLELWAVVPGQTQRNVLVDVSDSAVDNVEHLYVPARAGYRHYELVVILNEAAATTGAAAEPYAVAWNAAHPTTDPDLLWEDLNSDGIVNDLDLTLLAANRREASRATAGYVIGDVNADGVIDDADAARIASRRSTRALWYTP